MSHAASTIDEPIVMRACIVELETALAAERELRAEWELKHDRLLGAYQALQQQLELIKRRLYIAKAERIDTAQLDLEFAAKLDALNAIAAALGSNTGQAGAPAGAGGKATKPSAVKRRPRGRRNLLELDLPEERIELVDPCLEGKAKRIGAQEESCKLKWRRGGLVRLVVMRVKYFGADAPAADVSAAAPPAAAAPAADVPAADASADAASGVYVSVAIAPGADALVAPAPADIVLAGIALAGDVPIVDVAVATESFVDATVVGAADSTAAVNVGTTRIPTTIRTDTMTIITAPLPLELLSRCMAAPSLLAHIASDKFCDGLPLYRQEDRFARLGARIDRGTMSRWLEEVGMAIGATIVHAMHADAMRNAFCIATDATGVLIQPIRAAGNRQRRPCRKAHYFVQIADADHVFFEYTPKETSAAVGEMFRGFSGYIQADAKSVYDFLYRPPEKRMPLDDAEPDPAVCYEVGCWSHARRPLWETAVVTKDAVAREGLARIARIFTLDRSWHGKPPDHIKSMRDEHLRPHLDAYFEFVAVEYDRVKHQRGMLRSALGYSHRQRDALTRFLDDGRLKLTNNESERQLRRVL